MIALLVLFVFLMLNYLLWDKENLQNQSATDKFDLEQLRSTNRTLQTTINEQEQAINTLEKDNENYKTQAAEQQQTINQFTATQNSLDGQLNMKNQAIDDYKLLMADSLKLIMQQWFDNLTNRNYEAAFQALDSGYTLFGGHYGQDEFNSSVAALKSISFDQQNKDGAAVSSSGKDSKGDSSGKSSGNPDSAGTSTGDSTVSANETPALPVFEILPGRGGDYEIIALADVQVQVAEDKKDTYKDMTEGVNYLQISFRYNPANKTWAIFSIMGAAE